MNGVTDQIFTLIFGSISSVAALVLQSLANAVINSILIPFINSIAASLGLSPTP